MTEKPTYEELEQKIRELELNQLKNNQMEATPPAVGEWQSHKIDSKLNLDIDIPDLELDTIINIDEIQSIMDDFWHLTKMATAILDLKGKVIEATGWQDLCTKFHRINPKTAQNCTESDLFLAKNLKPGEYIDYKCKNGLWDVVTPLYVGSKHLGNIYAGQFFYDDEQVDEDLFIRQAEEYGFDKESYLEAFRRIPRHRREEVAHLMSFLVNFTTYISGISLANLKLEKEIRERKRVEETLQKREAHLQTLIENIPDLIWLKDSEGVYLSCNSKFERFFGAREADIVGKTDYDFVNKELADFFCEKDKVAMAAGKPTMNEEEVTFADDGHKELLETVKTPMFDTEGKLIGVLGIARDITERKQAEEKLIKAQTYISNIIDSMPTMLISVDTEGKVTQWNMEAQQATGVLTRDAVGQPLTKVIPRLASEMERIRRAISERCEQTGSKIARQEDNETLYEDISVYPLIANGVDGAVIRIDDVTDKVRMEEMMIQSEKMISVGGLAAGMAHEINNPLAGMMQTAHVMKDRLSDTEMAANKRVAAKIGISMDGIKTFMEERGILRMISSINESGHRVAEIVENMLSFARKSDSAVIDHDLNGLMDKTLELAATDYDLKKQYDFKLIEIKKEYENNLPEVPCEGAKIQQVLLNILRNGAQAMQNAKTEKPVFIVRTWLDKGQKTVCLEIEDNGPGMDEVTCKRIFEPFYTTKPVGEGTGLGLSVSYFIITENHGGELTVESRPGSGSKFIIRLPLEKRKD
ncbi:PocR ligand-binding domain-containing protein [bacterium]|nr:PocR ligand-binding domain-containing protein [bacterium]